jgi:hypothetical protein
MEIGMRYAQKGNEPQVRGAALRLVGAIGNEEPRVYPMISDTFKQALEHSDFNLAFASAEGLINLGDPRGITLFEDLAKQAEGRAQVQGLIRNFQEQLKKKLEAAAKPPAK